MPGEAAQGAARRISGWRRGVVLYLAALTSMLGGASAVHAALNPDLRLPVPPRERARAANQQPATEPPNQ